MARKVAKLSSNDGSQTVALPAEFRFDGDEVFVHRDERTGDVILSKKTEWTTWDEYFAFRDAGGPVPEEFMADRALNGAFTDKAVFGDEE